MRHLDGDNHYFSHYLKEQNTMCVRDIVRTVLKISRLYEYRGERGGSWGVGSSFVGRGSVGGGE